VRDGRLDASVFVGANLSFEATRGLGMERFVVGW